MWVKFCVPYVGDNCWASTYETWNWGNAGCNIRCTFWYDNYRVGSFATFMLEVAEQWLFLVTVCLHGCISRACWISRTNLGCTWSLSIHQKDISIYFLTGPDTRYITVSRACFTCMRIINDALTNKMLFRISVAYFLPPTFFNYAMYNTFCSNQGVNWSPWWSSSICFIFLF